MLAVLRLTTQQRLLQRPLGPEQALELVESWIGHPLVQVVEPGPQHWTLLRLLLEHNCTLCSADNGFRRFTGLRFTNPLY